MAFMRRGKGYKVSSRERNYHLSYLCEREAPNFNRNPSDEDASGSVFQLQNLGYTARQ